MRILAIRGKNLASIPEFELDLSSGPLEQTRIFAITGPTGAGKSTLLDALCLGLYDRAPRLFGSRDVPVGELGISALDPRSVMRRGTAEAHAEVDFVGKDGQRFRAIWEVWRAHKKSDGKIQNQRMRLIALDGNRELSGATKTETQKLIEEKVGLSFAEFRRAVLLAQGDFASFLRAKADERAELLERMTGTEIYAQLSRAAFARARREDERLAALEMRRAQIAVLSAEEAAALRESLETARMKRIELEERLRAVRAAEAWHRARREMIADRDRAIEELERARRAIEDAAELQEEVDRVAEAEKLRPQVEALRALDRAVARTAAALEDAETNAAFCRRHAAEAFEAAAEATAEKQRAEEERDRLQPELESAQKLDVQIEDARAHADEAAKRSLEAKKVWRHAEQKFEKLSDDLEAAEEELALLTQWFEANAKTKILAVQWPRWQRELERYADAAASAIEASEQEASLAKARAGLDAELEELARSRDEIAHAQLEAQAMVDRAKEEQAALRREVNALELKAALERIGLERSSLDAMRTIARETQRLVKLRAEAKKIAKSEAELKEAKLADATVARERKSAIEAELAEKAQRLTKLEAELDLAARRADLLVEGEPCPLCGSTEHPAKSSDAPELAVLERLRAQRSELEAERARAIEEIAAAEDAASRHATASMNAENRSTEIDSELELKKQDWIRRKEAMALVWLDSPLLAKRGINKIAAGLPDEPKAKGAIKALDRATEEMRAQAEELLALAEKEQRLAEGLEVARNVQDELTKRANELAPRIAAAEKKKSELTLRNEALARERKAALDAKAEAEAALEEALSARDGWKEALASDPPAYLRALATEVEAWERNMARAVEQKGRFAELSRATELALAEAERARRDRAKADAFRAERLAKQTALERRRRTLLSDRNVDEVQAMIAERISEANARAHEAENRHALANQALAAAEERLEHAHEAHREGLSRRDEERERLLAAIASSRFSDLASLEAALAKEPGWLERQRALLDALKEELTRKEAALADRQSRLSQHERTPLSGPPGDLEAAQAELLALEQRHGELIDEIARLQGKLTTDESARRSLSELEPQIAAQRWTLEQWSEMSALIGSADGKKLRTFAQGLTLDMLLLSANHHLQQLRPRYRLERVPGFDMELQVIDGDMGEEARPVGTLSGGETFLVSLALALGLSSLSSHQVKIESLFIDEGFGQLDREALDVALATLDQLQAEGRTIGIISHVPDIAERIGYQVKVEPKGPGRSEVRVLSP